MIKKIFSGILKWSLSISVVMGTFVSQAGLVKYVQVSQSVRLWTESFGNPDNPPILLIFGGISPSILWTDEFCQKLANSGFYVVRYDHRDAGGSSPVIDYGRNPYNLEDLADDGMAIINEYKLNQVHLVGMSMGAPIGAFLAVKYPERVLSLTAMISSYSFKPLLGITDQRVAHLTIPSQQYRDWIAEDKILMARKNLGREEMIEHYMKCWRIINGNKVPLDEKLYRKLVEETIDRMKNPYVAANHFAAMKASSEKMEEAYRNVKVPTLILGGSEDPIFSMGHSEALHQAIPCSNLKVIEGMGHNLNPPFFEQLINLIQRHSNQWARSG